VDAGEDFYVRDWTSPSNWDDGLEPSTNPVFWATSDVWNRRSTFPGNFPDDMAENEDAGNGLGSTGDNWFFCRIHRNASGSSGASVVTAHFLVSQFGAGNNFLSNNWFNGSGGVTFDPDPTVTFIESQDDLTTPASKWHLDPTASTHLCFVAEIAGPNDPYVAPSFAGYSGQGGWTDVRVVDDNNRAQRNVNLTIDPPGAQGQSTEVFAIAHDPGLDWHDMELRWTIPPESAEVLTDVRMRVVGGRTMKLGKTEGVFVLKGMLPGENRWIGLSWARTRNARKGQDYLVHFQEQISGTPISGFSMGARIGSLAEVIAQKIEWHRSLVVRLEATGLAEQRGDSERAESLTRQERVGEKDYLRFLAETEGTLAAYVKELVGREPDSKDVFGLRRSLGKFRSCLAKDKIGPLAAAHGSLVNAADAMVTMIRLGNGDMADILQMVRLEEDLVQRTPELAKLSVAGEVADATARFVAAWHANDVANADYRALLNDLADAHGHIAKKQSRARPALVALARALDGDDLAAMQRAHREFLLALHAPAA
jgi:hypothetical protein